MQPASEAQSPRAQKDLAKLSTIIAKPKFDPYITLVTNALNTASTADPLQQIKVIVFQGYAYNSTAKEGSKLDESELEIIRAVAGALLTPIRKPITPQKEVISIAWWFDETEECWKKYVAPWDHHFEYFQDKLPEEFKERLQRGGYKLKEDVPEWKRFFAASSCLTERGYQIMVNAFSDWCIPKVAATWSAVAKSVASRKEMADPSRVVVDVDHREQQER